MRTRVQRWGNSLAVRIPKSFAAELQLDNNSEVDLSLVNGQLTVLPVATPLWTLDTLLAGITEANVHQDVSTGSAVGQEVW